MKKDHLRRWLLARSSIISPLGSRRRPALTSHSGDVAGPRLTEGPLFRAHDIHHTPAGAAVFADGVLAGLRGLDLLPACHR